MCGDVRCFSVPMRNALCPDESNEHPLVGGGVSMAVLMGRFAWAGGVAGFQVHSIATECFRATHRDASSSVNIDIQTA